MKKKRIIFSMLTLLCCCMVTWADEVDNDTHLKYTVADDEVTITGFADDFTPGANYALVIPDVIDGKPVVAVGASAFIDKTNFTTLTIGKNVKTIGNEAFRKASTMTSVTFAPDGVLETLGESAFRGCAELTEFVMPNTVTTIGNYVLQANAKLASVILSNQLTTLSTQALCNCPMLKTVVIPASVTTIASKAFWHSNGGLEEITIPSTVTSVSSDAFDGCSNLKTVIWNSATVPENIFKDKTSLQTVTFGEGVTTIKNYAFQGCTGLTKLTILATLTKIETFAFTGCTNVTTVTTQDGTLAKTGDYYELSTLAHWRLFSVLVQANNTANAKMTADIDLGDDQTKIGMNNNYRGTFDGQGHTLTVNWTTQANYCAPFRLIDGATIKNLHVTGTINTSHQLTGGLIGKSLGTSYVNNCHSSVEMISSYVGDAIRGGFAACVDGGTLNFNDCIFDGKFEGASSQTWGGFVGWKYSGSVNIQNGLFVPKSVNVSATYSATFSGNGGTVTNSYYTVQINNSTQGTQATAEQLADGTITYKLQNNRGDLVWGQRIGTDAEPVLTNDESYRVYRSINGGYTNDPTLAYEGLQKDVNDNYLLGCVWDWKEFAEIVNSGTNNTANAKMTADIDLGDDQTMIGTNSNRYKGTFDGDGHTLTVNIVSGNIQFIAPFRYVQGGTIRNLRVNGTIASSGNHSSGLIGRAYDKINIEKCIVAANIQMSSDYAGGFVGNGGSKQYGGASQVVMRNCLFAGTFTGITYSRSKAAGFWGWGASTPAFINCLENGIYTNIAEYNPFMYEGTDNENIETTSNSYYKHGIISLDGISNASSMTATELATALNNGGEEVWVQDVLTNQPQLAIFANKYTVPSSGIGTFSAKAKFAVPEGLTAHYCKTYNSAAGTISVANIDGAVPANTGVLLRGTPGETYTLTGTNSEAATVTDNALVAVTEETSIAQESGDYVNFGLSGGVFKKVNAAGGTVKANRAYLHILKSSLLTEAKSIALAWDGETTGIANLNVDANDNFDANAPMYNLAGQRVGKSYKGIVVVNGKKVLIK